MRGAYHDLAFLFLQVAGRVGAGYKGGVSESTLIHTLGLDLADEAATRALAARLAALARPRDVIGLAGDLGSGKTALARAFIRARLGGDEDVPSPTFTLVQTYGEGTDAIYHFDLYRLQAPAEALALGIEDAFAEAISLIEWPERLGELIPPDRLDVTLTHGPRATLRTAWLVGRGVWAARLREAGLDRA